MKELLQVNLPSSNRRTHHTHDTDGVLTAQPRVEQSRSGEHMVVSDYVWKDVKTGAEIRESSQWGTHFDTPYHFDKNGLKYIPNFYSGFCGRAVCLDLRRMLSRYSNGYAITEVVIEEWKEAYGDMGDDDADVFLLRTLSDTDANSQLPLEKFPYFKNLKAVDALWQYTSERGTSILHPTLVCVEAPSVDRVDCGCLKGATIDGDGGAHGAFHGRAIHIGENFDFREIGNLAKGLLRVYLEQSVAPDSMKVVTALFEPDE